MTAISIMIEGQLGLNWPRWQRLVETVDGAGYAGLFRSDHFMPPRPPVQDALELIVSLTYLADHSQRLHFGPLVAPVSFRHPAHLARQAAALDDLSGGRMILGLGAGWMEREHAAFGFPLGDVPTRMARLEEGLEVVTRLLTSDEPVNYDGQFLQLQEAQILPRPARPGGPRILIGGNGPRRTLPLAARYATIWNAIALSAGAFQERSAQLDTLLTEGGRAPGDVQRTMMTLLFFGTDGAALERSLAAGAQLNPAVAGRTQAEQIAFWRDERHALVGTPDEVGEQIAALAAAGVEEVMVQWLDLDDLAGLEAFAATVLPLVGSAP